MNAAALELQKAIVDRLGADQSLSGIPVFDHVPRDQEMPYIVIDEVASDEWDKTPTENSDGYGEEHRVVIRIWSSAEGKKEVGDIGRKCQLALRDHYAMQLTGHHLINIRFLNALYGRDPDDQAFQGTQFYRVVTEEE